MTAAKILVVDDEPDVEALMKRRFRRHIREGRLEFVFAKDGVEGLEVIKSGEDVCIVLCDINMPRMDGLKLLEHLSEIDRVLETIMVSAYGDMKNIRTAMNRGAFDFVTKPIDYEDLSATINKTERHIQLLQEGREAKKQLTALAKELEIARRIQQSILPTEFPSNHGFDVFGRMLPVRAVGGDFYDVFPLGQDTWALLIADVSGKGIPAAIFMGVVHTMVRTIAATEPDPGKCLARANDQICANIQSGMLVSIFFAQYDAASGRLRYANAGHNPPYICTADSEATILSEGRGVVIGVETGLDYVVSELTLTPGDVVFLYTDGITEAMGPKREQFTEVRLGEALARNLELAPEALTQAIIDAVRGHTVGVDQNDDMTCVALQHTG